MNEKQLKKFFTTIGTSVEMPLLFYRSSVAAKATPEEAIHITQAFTAAVLNGGKSDNREGV